MNNMKVLVLVIGIIADLSSQFGGEQVLLKDHDDREDTAKYWIDQAQLKLKRQLQLQQNKGIAKNVILFLGDGMSLSTIAASRILLGQLHNKTGEETQLSFEKLPYTGLSKTYCIDRQIPDSACTATAYLCGTKSNFNTTGVTPAVKILDCKAMQNTSNHVYSIARWSQLRNKRTGFVTTTSVTDASPAGLYSHTASRLWENDKNIVDDGYDPKLCPDIAYQMIYGETGRNLNVMFGGGRRNFLPHGYVDNEGVNGVRLDKRHLIKEWQKQNAESQRYVTNRTELLNISNDINYALGLFAENHLDYTLDQDPIKTPSLTEMTEKAIKLLSKGQNGYFLFVEGGNIDKAHHISKPKKALYETIEFHKAVEAAIKITNSKDTLIVVTSDHSQSLSFSGHPIRGNDILGIAGIGADLLPYTALTYATGPGYRHEENGHRHDISLDDTSNKDYTFPTFIPRHESAHSGEDVAVFASGPWAHLFSGTLDQTVIPHIMAYASCVGNGITLKGDWLSDPKLISIKNKN